LVFDSSEFFQVCWNEREPSTGSMTSII